MANYGELTSSFVLCELPSSLKENIYSQTAFNEVIDIKVT